MIVLGALVSQAGCVMFDLASGKVKCFSEDLPANTLVVGRCFPQNLFVFSPLWSLCACTNSCCRRNRISRMPVGVNGCFAKLQVERQRETKRTRERERQRQSEERVRDREREIWGREKCFLCCVTSNSKFIHVLHAYRILYIVCIRYDTIVYYRIHAACMYVYIIDTSPSSPPCP